MYYKENSDLSSKNELLNARVVLKSKLNNNIYYLFKDKIVVYGESTQKIDFPKNGGLICFYDMYYVYDKLYVIFNTNGIYDVAYILDENNYSLIEKGFQK